jgi:hypothetical protein
MQLIRLSLGSLLFVLVFSAQVRGTTITVYTDAPAFTAAAGSTTLIDFEAQNPYGDSLFQHYETLLTVGDVSFAQPEGHLFVFGKDHLEVGLTSAYLNQNTGDSGIDVSFANGVSAVGMALGYMPFDPVSTNAITFTLSTGDVIHTTAPNVWLTTNPLVFVGFTSDVPIVSFNVDGPSHGVVLDDFRYAESLAAVPDLTTTLSLLGMSLAGLIAARKRFSL